MEYYEKCKRNENNMSFWLPKIRDKGFNIPDTVIVDITPEELEWLQSDSYKKEDIEEFSQKLQKRIKETGFNTKRDLFIKTGTFSGKFCFKFCHLSDFKNIGQQFLDVFYSGMCVGCSSSPEVVVREFIHTASERGTIYEGMKLNTEFRCFYDFEKQCIMGIFNYWDTKTMMDNLWKPEDREAFSKESKTLEKEFEEKKEKLREHILANIGSVDMKGQWSIDFMADGEKFWLIDMAKAAESYYYNLVAEQGE